MHAFTIQRDPRNFSRPDAFWPERWLRPSDPAHSTSKGDLPKGDPPTDDEAPWAHNEGAFLAFSHGPMNCVGRALAAQELRTVMCTLVRRFRVRVPGGGRLDLGAYEAAFRDFFVSARPPLRVVLEVRGES